jgi:hypothetical protein
VTTRPDLGDVSRRQLVTIDNFYEFFNGLLDPKQLAPVALKRCPGAPFLEVMIRSCPTGSSSKSS